MADEKEAYEEGLKTDYGPSREPTTLYVNNFYVTTTDTIIRIAFGESAEEPITTKYRVAVALSFDDAKELAALIVRLAREVEEERVTEEKQ